MVTQRTVQCMNINQRYLKETKAVTQEDSSSIDSKMKPYAFKAETVNLDAKSMTSSEIIRALYSGDLKSDEVTLSFVELNGGQDVDKNDSCSLSIPTSSESVQTVCNCLAIHVDAESATDSVQTSVNGEELS